MRCGRPTEGRSPRSFVEAVTWVSLSRPPGAGPPRRASIGPVTPVPTLVAEATRRSGVVWVSPAGGTAHSRYFFGAPTAPALPWHLWHEDRMYVVGGGQEQPLPLGAGPRS